MTSFKSEARPGRAARCGGGTTPVGAKPARRADGGAPRQWGGGAPTRSGGRRVGERGRESGEGEGLPFHLSAKPRGAPQGGRSPGVAANEFGCKTDYETMASISISE